MLERRFIDFEIACLLDDLLVDKGYVQVVSCEYLSEGEYGKTVTQTDNGEFVYIFFIEPKKSDKLFNESSPRIITVLGNFSKMNESNSR